MTQLVSTLSRALKAFNTPSTLGNKVAMLLPGQYPILEYLPHQDQGNNDFAKVQGEGLPEEGAWICTRSFGTHYATVTNQAGFSAGVDHGDLFSVRESDVFKNLCHYGSFGYTLDGAAYPYALPNLSVKLSGQKTNCCTFAEGLLVKTFHEQSKLKTWNLDLHKMMMIAGSTQDVYSPISAVAQAGMGVKIPDHHAKPGPWTLIQGWRSLDPLQGGHTFMVLRHHAPSDKVLTLEATNLRSINGVGHRGIGRVSFRGGMFRFPENWWELDSVPTWNRIKETFPHMETAALYVIPDA